MMLAWLLAAAVVPQAPARPTVETRVQRAEDEVAIRRLLIDYHWTLDAHDFAGYAALFAKEGEWVNGSTVRKGPEAILAMLAGLYGPPKADYVNRESFHLTTNIEVDVNGDRATARSRHLLITRGPDGRPLPTLAGQYDDQLVREDGKWKFLRRVDTPIMPTAEEWSKIMRERRAAAK